MREFSIEVFKTFADLPLSACEWNELARTSASNHVFLTYQWQRTWWESFGRGELLLVVGRRSGQVVALAPLFSEAGMIYLVGSGGSDYLEILGDTSDFRLVTAMLDAARDCVEGFIGFVFYMAPDASSLGHRLSQAAGNLNCRLFEEGSLPAPRILLTDKEAMTAANKSSLLRHERYFVREGKLEVHHFREEGEILSQLDQFFEQHIRRWRDTPYPSLFLDSRQQTFYQRVTQAMAPEGWLRFTAVHWNGQPIAFHFGFYYAGSLMWYKPSFDIELARRSPGEVLLRHLLLMAHAEQATVFDFGVGDEVFKHRFANHVENVRTWGLYAPEQLSPELVTADGPSAGEDLGT